MGKNFPCCRACGAPSPDARARLCPPCRAVLARLTELHRACAGRTLDRTERRARVDRYTARAAARLPLFE